MLKNHKYAGNNIETQKGEMKDLKGKSFEVAESRFEPRPVT